MNATRIANSIARALYLLLIATNLTVFSQETEPKDLIAARKAYEKEFVFKVRPLQIKYRQALENFKSSFTRAGDLPAAREADAEIQLVYEWANISPRKGQRVLKNAQLHSLLQNFEEALDREVSPIKKRYVNELGLLKQKYSSNGELNSAVSVDEELKKITTSLPLDAGRIEYYSGLDKVEFGEWLTRQSFDFSGAFSGFTKLKFSGDVMSYSSGGTEKQYEYKLATPRSLELNGGHKEGGWTIEFATDLQSGTFQTRDNIYPIRINPEPVVGGNGG